MSKTFSLDSITNGILSDASKNTAPKTFEIVNIPFDSIIPNEKNKYSVEDIDLLAESIKENGLEQNMLVKPIGEGKYKLIAGHRRRLAIEKLHKEDPSIYEYVPCKVETNIVDDSDETIRLVLNNATIRDMTEQDKIQQYETLKEAVEQKIQSGEKVGVKRQYLAKLLQVSEAQIQRYKNISENLIPELKEKVNTGDIGIAAADTYAKMAPEKQKEIGEKIEEKEDKKESVSEGSGSGAADENPSDLSSVTNSFNPAVDTQTDNSNNVNIPDEEKICWADISPLKKLIAEVKKAFLPNNYVVIEDSGRRQDIQNNIQTAETAIENIFSDIS